MIVKSVKELRVLLRVLRDSMLCEYKMLIDIVGVDMSNGQIGLRYILRSVRRSKLIVIKIAVSDFKSIVDLYEGADWVERENWDMLGVAFEGNKDLRRILTDYGFKGNPMLKTYGDLEEFYYDEEKKSVRDEV